MTEKNQESRVQKRDQGRKLLDYLLEILRRGRTLGQAQVKDTERVRMKRERKQREPLQKSPNLMWAKK